MTRLELGIAWRYLRSRGGSRLFSFISAIAIGGVIVGVSALIVINGVMTGMQDDLRDKILIGSPDLRVLTFGDDLRMDDWKPALSKVRAQPGIVAASPFVLSQGLAVPVGRTFSEAVFVEGIDPADSGSAEVTRIRHYATEGDFSFVSSDGERQGAVLGSDLAKNLNVYIGDRINLISPADAKFNVAVGSIIPNMFQVEVTGIFETGMYEYDYSYLFVDLDVARQFAGLGAAVTGIEAKTATRSAAGEVGRVLADSLGYPYRVVDWQAQNSSLFQALKLEKLVMAVILLLIVVVAAFNIVSTLSMVVKDKTREIGILKAMGLPASSVRRIFLVQGVVIGGVGTLIGLIIGVGAGIAVDKLNLIKLDAKVYFIDHLPVAIRPLDVFWIVTASVLIAVLATVYPSYQAARLYPVEAIRHE